MLLWYQHCNIFSSVVSMWSKEHFSFSGRLPQCKEWEGGIEVRPETSAVTSTTNMLHCRFRFIFLICHSGCLQKIRVWAKVFIFNVKQAIMMSSFDKPKYFRNVNAWKIIWVHRTIGTYKEVCLIHFHFYGYSNPLQWRFWSICVA